MSQYVLKDNVPILDEHVLLDEDGDPITTLDERKLRAIAAKANRRVAETGDEVPIVIGHTRDGAPEDRQPEIVGYARGFKVIPFARTGKKCLAALFRFMRDKLDKVRQFPRRSIELWLSDWKIDPISLLGATTPERDLGLLRLSRDGVRKYRRVLPATNTPKSEPVDQTKEIVDAVLAALKESDVWKWAESQMQSQEQPEQEPGLEGDDLLPEEDEDADDLDLDNPDLEDETDDEPAPSPPVAKDKPVKMAASAPGGSNTCVPGPLKDRKRMQRDAARTASVRFQREKQAMWAEVGDLRLKLQRTNRERDLIQLESEGFVLDRVEELDAVQALPEDTYRKHLSRIRKRYSRAPVGSPAWRSESLRSEQQGTLTMDQAREIAAHAAKKGVSYAQAKQELTGSAD
jgi:hypothetical protein